MSLGEVKGDVNVTGQRLLQVHFPFTGSRREQTLYLWARTKGEFAVLEILAWQRKALMVPFLFVLSWILTGSPIVCYAFSNSFFSDCFTDKYHFQT